MIEKIKRIVLSRFKKPDKNHKQEINRRRNICKVCPLNTKNLEKTTPKLKLIKSLSDFYTWITRSENEDLGECSKCGCTLFYKTIEPDEECPQGKWKTIKNEDRK